jgi:hypothetical protein
MNVVPMSPLCPNISLCLLYVSFCLFLLFCRFLSHSS